MRLYMGGAFQGKKDYVMALFPDAYPAEGESFSEDAVAGRDFVWNNLHLYIRDGLAKGRSEREIEEKVLKIAGMSGCLAVICNEVGSGVVPIKKEERIFREVCGRIMTKLAAKAEGVERIVCGIAVKIK